MLFARHSHVVDLYGLFIRTATPTLARCIRMRKSFERRVVHETAGEVEDRHAQLADSELSKPDLSSSPPIYC